MDDAAGRADAGHSPPAQGDLDRIEALEQQVRQLTSRLAGWVEAQLVQALDDRRNDMKALRAELQAVLSEQLAGLRAESSSVLSVTTRRLEVAQDQLSERLDTAAERASEAAARTLALASASSTEGERLGVVELQVAQLPASVHDQVRGELETLRRELAGLPSAGEALEQRVRSAMARLSDSVEGRLDDSARDRRSELEALRAELAALAEERAALAEERASRDVHEQTAVLSTGLGRRLDEVATQVAMAAEEIGGLRAEAEAGPARIDAFEQRVKAAMSRLTDSVERRLAETGADRRAGIDEVRAEFAGRADALQRDAALAVEGVAELQAAVRADPERTENLEKQMQATVARLGESFDTRLADLAAARRTEVGELRAGWADATLELQERVDATGLRTAAVDDRVSELKADAEAATARTDELEQRVKAAVGRLAESVETRLAEVGAAQSAELRTEVDTAAAELRARYTQVQDRVDAVEARQHESEERVAGVIQARLDAVVDRRVGEFEALRGEMEEALAVQLAEARSEVGAVVADAHRRFVVSVDSLHERMNMVVDQSAAADAAVAGIGPMKETMTSDGRRIEALEIHTRRTDARLGDVVDAKLSELAGRQGTEIEGVQRQLRAALDAHLAETRAEVTLALSGGRQELVAGTTRLEERQAALEQQTAQAIDAIDALIASAEGAVVKAEDRLGRSVQAKLSELATVVAQVTESRTEVAAELASMTRKVATVQDQVRRKVAAVVEQVEGMARTATSEAGTLAPLRSDLRLLQAQVAELADVLADLRPRRKAPATPARRVAAPAETAPAVKAATRAVKAGRPAAAAAKATRPPPAGQATRPPPAGKTTPRRAQ